ncbi:hypothetical protein ACFHW2_11590 [Actinomadura sp. LOL_016]|uniref:hypothetical protein n=1 Tax=unclassified Actinomadura TaxID=2626254 RepID=UPI003A80C86D
MAEKTRPGDDPDFKRTKRGWLARPKPAAGSHWSRKACDACRNNIPQNPTCRACNGTGYIFHQREGG